MPLGIYLGAATARLQANFAERIDHLQSLTYSEARSRFIPLLVREQSNGAGKESRVGSLEDLAPKPGELAF
jgi:hypothetical protein